MAFDKTEKASLVLSFLGHALLLFLAVSAGARGPGGGNTLMVEMVEVYSGSAAAVSEKRFSLPAPGNEGRARIEELRTSFLTGKTGAEDDAVERKKLSAVNEEREIKEARESPLTAAEEVNPKLAVDPGNSLSFLSDGPAEEEVVAAAASSAGTSGMFSLPGGPVGEAGEEMGASNRMALVVNIRSAIQNAVVYPLLARKRGMEGTVLAEVVIGFEGIPYEVNVRESSGHGILDREAVRAVRTASPYPGFRGVVEVPVTFRLSDEDEGY